MWELDYKKSWVPKNWCFWTVVLEKTLENALDCKEIQPVHPIGDQPWVFFGRTDVEAETPILWSPDAKSWLIGKDPDAGKDWGRGRRGRQMIRWLNGITNSKEWVWVDSGSWVMNRDTWHAMVHGVTKSRTWLSDYTELNLGIDSSYLCECRKKETYRNKYEARDEPCSVVVWCLIMTEGSPQKGSYVRGLYWPSNPNRHPMSLQGEQPEMGETFGPNFPFLVTFSWSLWPFGHLITVWEIRTF